MWLLRIYSKTEDKDNTENNIICLLYSVERILKISMIFKSLFYLIMCF